MEAETGRSSALVTLRSVSCDSLTISAHPYMTAAAAAAFARTSAFAGSERTNSATSEAEAVAFHVRDLCEMESFAPVHRRCDKLEKSPRSSECTRTDFILTDKK